MRRVSLCICKVLDDRGNPILVLGRVAAIRGWAKVWVEFRHPSGGWFFEWIAYADVEPFDKQLQWRCRWCQQYFVSRLPSNPRQLRAAGRCPSREGYTPPWHAPEPATAPQRNQGNQPLAPGQMTMPLITGADEQQAEQ